MKSSRLLLLLILAGLPGKGVPQADDNIMVREAREAALQLSTRLRELSKSLSSSGPLRALAVRKYSMPEISSALSRQTGWKVGMVSLRPRNPALATPDAWEREVLVQFQARLQSGEKPDQLEHYETVSEGSARYFRYMKGIVLSNECLACHGENIAREIKAQLANDYPHDRSTGYRLGELRGAVTVKRPL